jgi:aarF domain-containing kinase
LQTLSTVHLLLSAQVHAAVLKSSNKEVVIKVLKPGVEDVLATGEW